MAVQVAWFAAMAVAMGRSDIIDGEVVRAWGGLAAPLTWPESWRLVSAAFVHADPISLIGAVVLTAAGGTLIEHRVGARHTLLVFGFAALASNGLAAAAEPIGLSMSPAGGLGLASGALVVWARDRKGVRAWRALIVVGVLCLYAALVVAAMLLRETVLAELVRLGVYGYSGYFAGVWTVSALAFGASLALATAPHRQRYTAVAAFIAIVGLAAFAVRAGDRTAKLMERTSDAIGRTLTIALSAHGQWNEGDIEGETAAQRVRDGSLAPCMREWAALIEQGAPRRIVARTATLLPMYAALIHGLEQDSESVARGAYEQLVAEGFLTRAPKPPAEDVLRRRCLKNKLDACRSLVKLFDERCGDLPAACAHLTVAHRQLGHLTEARTFATRGVQLGDPASHFYLAEAYRIGWGGAQDLVKARLYHEQGCDLNMSGSCAIGADMALMGIGGPIVEAQATTMRQRACKLGNSTACRALQ